MMWRNQLLRSARHQHQDRREVEGVDLHDVVAVAGNLDDGVGGWRAKWNLEWKGNPRQGEPGLAGSLVCGFLHTPGP